MLIEIITTNVPVGFYSFYPFKILFNLRCLRLVPDKFFKKNQWKLKNTYRPDLAKSG